MSLSAAFIRVSLRRLFGGSCIASFGRRLRSDHLEPQTARRSGLRRRGDARAGIASGTSTVTLSIYVDGVARGTVTDSSSPYTIAGSGFGLQGDGTPADSTVNEWQDYSGTSPAPAPIFTPAAGEYTSAQTVTISDAAPGATIYYTTNGTAPSTGSILYSAPITVAASQTVEAIAIAPEYLQSPAAASTYIISPPFFGCPAGSGSCVDNFTGASGTPLPTYNSQWV